MSGKKPPGPKGHPIWGLATEFRENRLDFLTDNVRQYGDLVSFRLVHLQTYLLANPAYIREVLVTQADKFPKAPLERQILGKFLGNGLLTSEGNFHRRQRRLAQPAFHSKRINNYAETMVAYTEQMLAQWQPGQVRNIAADMERLTMFIVAKTLFDADAVASQETAEAVGRAIHDLQRVSSEDYERGFVLPDWLPTPNNRTRRQAVAAFNDVIMQIIAARRETAVNGQIEDRGDLLSMLMLAQDEDGAVMDDQQLRDEVATLFVAGHETTSNALSWTWYLLSQHPDAANRLYEELDTVLRGRTPALEDLPRLPYTLMVIKEAMRLYPPAWILNGRQAQEEVEMGGYTIKKGGLIFISPYVMHRLPQYFPDPERFDPERFTPEREKALPRFAYMPFGGGPRICIGNAFALMEAHLILATIAQRYRLALTPGQTVEPLPQITMSPKDGLWMEVAERERVGDTAVMEAVM